MDPHPSSPNEATRMTRTGANRLKIQQAFAAALFVLSLCSTPSSGAEKPLIRTRLKVAFNQSNFVSVNRNDAEAAFKVFVETAGKKRGYAVQSEMEVFNTAAEFAKGIVEKRVQLAIIDCWDYLSFDLRGVMEPAFVFVEPGGALESYVLVTGREKGAQSLQELRGQDIVLLENANANLSRLWLETMLLERNLGGAADFFKKTETVAKASAAVLPVFFGQRAACIVDQSAFDLMNELNPQVGKRLQAIQTSAPFLDTILCLSIDGWPTELERKDLIDILAELHQGPEGLQLLTVFKVSKLEPFKAEHLTTVRELKAAHDRFMKTLEKNAAPARAGRNENGITR